MAGFVGDIIAKLPRIDTDPQIASNHMHRKDKDNRDDLLDGLATLAYHTRMSHFVRGSTRHWVAGDITVVDFRPLYTVTVHDLQRRLAEEIQKIGTEDLTDQRLEYIRDTLHKYSKSRPKTRTTGMYETNKSAADALRDFEFIHSNRWETQFVKDIAASRLDNGPGSRLQGSLIAELGLQAPVSHRSLFRDSDVLGSFDHTLMQHSMAIGQSLGAGRLQELESQKRQQKIREMTRRFCFAILGGLIIVTPVLILTAGTASATPRVLGVISASIFLFALAVALFSNTKPENLLAATAAYSAVLVSLMEDGITATV